MLYFIGKTIEQWGKKKNHLIENVSCFLDVGNQDNNTEKCVFISFCSIVNINVSLNDTSLHVPRCCLM